LNNIDKNSLVEFYFGSLPEEKRLHIEKEMLTDPEILLDYLDLKREIEGSQLVPQQPSKLLWQRLRHVAKKKQAWYITLAVGALAATIAFIYLMNKPNVGEEPFMVNGKILFDSGAEHPLTSDVL